MAKKKMFRNEDDARQVARRLCSDPVAADIIGSRMFQADAAGENSCFLHQSALHYHTDCICSVCAPGAARGLFAGVVLHRFSRDTGHSACNAPNLRASQPQA